MDTLAGGLTNAIKDNSKVFGIVGAVMGAALVIAYCGSINFYPSGLTIADTLFFYLGHRGIWFLLFLNRFRLFCGEHFLDFHFNQTIKFCISSYSKEE